MCQRTVITSCIREVCYDRSFKKTQIPGSNIIDSDNIFTVTFLFPLTARADYYPLNYYDLFPGIYAKNRFIVQKCKRSYDKPDGKSYLTISAGDKEHFTAYYNGKTDAEWNSSDESVATISGKGVLKAVKAGKTYVTATVDGQTSEKLKVIVKDKGEELVPLKKLKCYNYYRKWMTEAEFEKVYKKAVPIVKPLLNLSKKEKLLGVATRLRNLYDEGKVDYSMKIKHYDDPYGYLVKGVASCAGCARVTRLCLNMLGIDGEHVNEFQYSHQWMRVKVGSEYWICDAYGLRVCKEPGKKKYPSDSSNHGYIMPASDPSDKFVVWFE